MKTPHAPILLAAILTQSTTALSADHGGYPATVPGYACQAQCLSVDYAAGEVISLGWMDADAQTSRYAALRKLQRKCSAAVAELGAGGGPVLALDLEFHRHDYSRSESSSSSSAQNHGQTHWQSSSSQSGYRRFLGYGYSSAVRDELDSGWGESESQSDWRLGEWERDVDIRAPWATTRNACERAPVDANEYYQGPLKPQG